MMKARRVIMVVILLLAMVGMIGIWPLGIVTRETESKSKAATYYNSSAISEGKIYKQEFIPKENYIEGISIQLNRDSTMKLQSEGTTTLILYNENGEICAQKTELTKDVTNKDYFEFLMNTSVTSGDMYYFTVMVAGCAGDGPNVRFGNRADIGMEENISINVNNTDFPQYSTVCIYHYRTNLKIWDILTYYSLILFVVSFFVCDDVSGMVYYREILQWGKRFENRN